MAAPTCTCGYTRFSERRYAKPVTTLCWYLYAGAENGGGLGAGELGDQLGSEGGPGAEVWNATYAVTFSSVTETRCESCGRPRNKRVKGGLTPVGAYLESHIVYLVAPALPDISCYVIEFRSSTYRVSSALRRSELAAGPLDPALYPVEEAAETPPSGAVVAASLYYIEQPDLWPGEYDIFLIDRCGGTELALGLHVVVEGSSPYFDLYFDFYLG